MPPARATARALITALLVAMICWYLGADIWRSILFGAVLTTVGLICLGASAPDPSDTEWRAVGRPNLAGARSDVAQLSGSLRGRYGRVGYGVVWHLQQIARHRLARYQLDLGNPADGPRIEQLIGRRAYTLLVGRRRRPPLLRSVRHCLDALDALGVTRPTAPAGPGRPTAPFMFQILRRARER
ncbi:MAG TPA: hypothetical protein VGL69_01050 [Solirubrobacteraceae bacterium]